MPTYGEKLKILSGKANPRLAQDICEYLDTELVNADISRFSDGEINIQIKESVRGADVFVLQPTCPPVNENLMELLVIIDALRRASARRITAVIPYYGYARQDRKAQARDPITAKMVANLLTVAGARRMLFVDLHAAQIQGFFDTPVDHLLAAPLIAEYFKKKELENVIIVSPDVGGVKMVRDLARRMHTEIAIIDKRRPKPNVSEVMNVIGSVEDKTVIIYDDLIDTGGSVTEAACTLKERGARDVYVGATHGVLSGPAIDRLKTAPIEEIVLTDTIPPHNVEKLDNLTVLSTAKLIGKAIWRIYQDLSVSVLFKRK